MITQKDLKTIRIKKEVHDKLKIYCDKNNLKMYKWLESIIIEKIGE
jgi:hypothetical protein